MTQGEFNEVLEKHIPPQSSVLYVGCGNGSLLNRLNPKFGIGIDTDKDTIRKAEINYPEYSFFIGEIETISLNQKFEFIVLDGCFSSIGNIFSTLQKLRNSIHTGGKLIINEVHRSSLFNGIIDLVNAKESTVKNMATINILEGLLPTVDFRPLSNRDSIIIASAFEPPRPIKYSYSIIIPCYNEEDNICNCINSTSIPDREYEIIAVDDGSSDQTSKKVRSIMSEREEVRLVSYPKNRGKGYATKKGMDAAKNDVLIILDADMTVRPKDLSMFILPFEKNTAQFVNGTRMAYPMERGAMPPVNVFGNKIFAMIFSFVMNQRLSDTLCGTKCMYKKDYRKMSMEDDAWPDFDHLFGARKLKLKIAEIPIIYRQRVSGESKMRTFKHGFKLLKASLKGVKEFKL